MIRNLLRRESQGTIALVTANFGGIDAPKPLPGHPGIEAIYYTDAATAASVEPEARRTWDRVLVPNYPRYDFNPRLRAKYFKLQIHRLDEVRGHRWLVWADGSVQFHDLDFVTRCARALARLPARRRVLLVPHPDRQTVWQEYRFVEDEMAAGNAYLVQRYALEKMPEQMEYFRTRGWNLHARLWCGTFWMMENAEPLRRAWDAWWDQNLRFGLMDQLSLPVILADHAIEPEALDVNLWRNEHFTWVSHRAAM